MSGWTGTPSTWTQSTPAGNRVSTSPTEIRHLFVASAVLTLDFAILVGGLRFGVGSPSLLRYFLLPALLFGVVAAMSGFIAHEMAHKIVAQRRGYWAEFRMAPMWLVLSLVTAVLGFLFAAPGATVVSGMSERRAWGLTSVAGPAVNLVEGGAFLAVAYLFSAALGPWSSFVVSLAFFNGWFAAFNLIPIGPLDGRKVLHWSLGAWIGIFVLAAGFTVFTYFLPTFSFAP